ncbi:hypothetical protein NEOLEDRAFT_1066959 [Neolentinus lepideus HHB14362 ss-1]|uniref:Uncharacterized protein n=1 Tax=Neolentinus lepideus HHB14362 ss-1 TaxID=1314782 RepID=A0A165S6U5_9AGAM|nr:hypothetical protein NEOLEDRAFT_1066959 [Neolentinus lepideus HHB14362 ss-1]
MTGFNVPTICINEDTLNDKMLWKQLGTHQGHLPHFAKLLQSHAFARLILYVHVDEAHNLSTMGLPCYGEKPFRPTYGQVG